jgi:hypothetical protein
MDSTLQIMEKILEWEYHIYYFYINYIKKWQKWTFYNIVAAFPTNIFCIVI